MICVIWLWDNCDTVNIQIIFQMFTSEMSTLTTKA